MEGGRGERASVSAGADRKENTLWGDGALEVGDLCLLEDGSERGGALDSDVIVLETARDGWEQACQRALTRKQTLGSWFERRAAYSSDCSVVLPLRASARAITPSE